MYGLTEEQYERFMKQHPDFGSYSVWGKNYALYYFKNDVRNYFESIRKN